LSVVDEVADLLFVFYNGAAPPVAAPAVAGLAASEITVAPNPMLAGRGTTIRLATTAGAAGPVALEIFDVAGRRVRTLGVERDAASVDWDGRNESGGAVPAGVYMIRVSGTDRELTTTVRVLR
jgi:flagellar hook assembly protein FlgD